MHISRIALAATPILFTTVSAYGNAIIKNSCGDDVYFWSCGDKAGDMITVPAGESHSEEYFTKKDKGGPSLKIAVKSKAGKIPDIWQQPAPEVTQFEYTVGSDGPPSSAVFYDISNIDGYPFVAGGVKVTSSDGSVNVACPKGVRYCQKAYNAPKDDHATGSAPDHVDLIMELCHEAPGMIVGGQNAGSGGSSGGSSDGPSGGSPSEEHHSSTPVASPSSSPSPSHSDSSSEVVAPEKHAVKAPEPQQQQQQPTSSSTPPPPPQITPSPTSQDVVVVWNTVTADPVVVTVHQDAPQKRHEHVHQHVHNKINKKRHGNN